MTEAKRKGPFSNSSFHTFCRRFFEETHAIPEMSVEAYFATKESEIHRFLKDKTLIYLDTCHWVNLRHVVMKSGREQQSYRDILGILNILWDQERICCPFSFLLFLELMRQNDPKTREETAKLMDRFSHGICFKFPNDMALGELRQFCMRDIKAAASSISDHWMWTKVGFLAGELLPEISIIPGQDNCSMQKLWIDFMWSFPLEMMIKTVDDEPINLPRDDFWERYAAASNMDAAYYRTSCLSYKEVLEREKALIVRGLMKEELQVVCQELWEAFPEVRDPSKCKLPSEADYSPWNFPSIEILAGINAADMRSSKRFTPNDMLDFRHAALAIPYCDAVFCDGPMARRLSSKPCQFGEVYGTQILGRPHEILEYLETLRR